MEELTDKQRPILKYIEDRARQTGFRPTLDEVRRHFGFRSINGAVVHIKALERKGYLREPEAIRGSPATPAVMIPVLGLSQRENQSLPRSTSRNGSSSRPPPPPVMTTSASS